MASSVAPDAGLISTPRGESAADTAPSLPTSTPPSLARRNACRVCGNDRLMPYLHLGQQPLANAFRAPDDTSAEPRFPLAVRACPVCKLSQLTHVVSADVLYAQPYAFAAGVSKAWQTHCARFADAFARPGLRVLDVASNDGTLVREFATRGCDASGVDPAPNFADGSYPLVSAFWTHALAQTAEFVGRIDLLCATNVLGHVDDVQDFARGIATALAPAGRAVIEVPYVVDMLDALTYDLVYHEHLSYWSVTALHSLARDAGLVLADVQRIHTHGGSIRATFAVRGTASAAVTKLMVDEHHDLRRAAYMRFSERVSGRMAQLNVWAQGLAPYLGFGASAKATVLLGTLNVEAYPTAVVDDNPAKQGRLVPGTRVPVIAAPDWSRETRPVVVFTWNQVDAIARKLRRAGYTGAIHAPFPVPHTVA